MGTNQEIDINYLINWEWYICFTNAPTTEPTTEPTVEPIMEPTTEPTNEPIVTPTMDNTVETTIESIDSTVYTSEFTTDDSTDIPLMSTTDDVEDPDEAGRFHGLWSMIFVVLLLLLH